MKRHLPVIFALLIAGPSLADTDSTYGGTFRDPGVSEGDGTDVTVELVGGNALVYCVEFPDQKEPNCFGNAHIPYKGSSEGKFTFSAPDFGKWEFVRKSSDRIDVTFTHVGGHVSFAELMRGVAYSEISK